MRCVYGRFGTVMHISFVCSYLWFIVMCKDLDRTMRDPFSFYSSWHTRYHIFVWGLGTISMMVLLWPPVPPSEFRDEAKGDTNDMYGTDLWGQCWIRETTGINWCPPPLHTPPTRSAGASSPPSSALMVSVAGTSSCS